MVAEESMTDFFVLLPNAGSLPEVTALIRGQRSSCLQRAWPDKWVDTRNENGSQDSTWWWWNCLWENISMKYSNTINRHTACSCECGYMYTHIRNTNVCIGKSNAISNASAWKMKDLFTNRAFNPKVLSQEMDPLFFSACAMICAWMTCYDAGRIHTHTHTFRRGCWKGEIIHPIFRDLLQFALYSSESSQS